MPTDQSDPVAVLREHADEIATACRHAPFNFRELLAELERRQGREKRLEALVRELGECRYGSPPISCNAGRLKYWSGSRDPEFFDEPCPGCAGTGLIEAARKEIENG